MKDEILSRAGLAMIVLCLLLLTPLLSPRERVDVRAGLPMSSWDASNKAFCFKRNLSDVVTNCTADTLVPNTWLSGHVFAINHDAGSPQYFTLFLDVEGFGSSHGLPNLKCLVTAMGRSEVRGYTEWVSGADSVICFSGVTDTTRMYIELTNLKGGDYAQLWFYNSGDTVYVNVDSSYVWMKH